MRLDTTRANGNTAPDTEQVGFSGVQRFRGLVTEEYLPALRGTRKIETYDRMRSDGMVQAILAAVRLPVIAASWTVEPAGTDGNAKRAAELVEAQLFDRLGHCWEEEVRNLLTYLAYGFAVSAKNWRVERGEVVLHELRALHPRSLLAGGKNWDYDPETGELRGVWQYGPDGERYREEYIPRAAMVHLVNEAEFGNPEGRSLLRAAYKHWLVKDDLYRYGAIGAERGAVGLPLIRYPVGTSEAKQRELLDLAQRIYVHESAGAVVPEGVEVENFSIKVDIESLMEQIRHHDSKIAQSVLAQFLTLGQEGNGGAYALSADQTDLFLLSLESVADYLAARINRDVIPEMVGYNLATDQYPHLAATISRRSAAALAGMIRPLVAGQNAPVTWGEADEDWLREQLQLPPRTEERPARTEPQPQPAPANGRRQGEMAGGRERLTVLQDPAPFREEPAYPELGRVIEEFRAAAESEVEALREALFRAARLEAPEELARTFRQFPELTPAQRAALDAAIARFLAEFAGEDRSEAGFVGVESEDALLQGFARLAHAVGVGQAVRQTGAAAAALAPTRESPTIRRLLTDAFRRLSTAGRLRLEDQLEEVREVLVTGAEEGRNAMDVARDLRRRLDRFQRHELERLVRTEMAYAANQGHADELQAESVARAEVLVSALACPICQAHAGAVVDLAAARVGEELPPFHPHCLCSLAALVE